MAEALREIETTRDHQIRLRRVVDKTRLLDSKFWSAEGVGGFLALVDGDIAAGVFENVAFCSINSICGPFGYVLGAVRV